MKQIKPIALVILALIFIVLNVLFFLWVDPPKCGTPEWLSYGFMVGAFLFAAISMISYKGRSEEVYSLTVLYIPFRYFTIQSILSAAGIYYAGIIRGMESLQTDSQFFYSHYSTLLASAYIIVLAIYLIRYIIHCKANDITESSLNVQAQEHAYVKDLSVMLSNMMPVVTDAKTKKTVNALYETIRFSANKTNGKGSKEVIAEGIERLGTLIDAKEWEAAAALAEELNNKAKMIR